MPAEELKMKLVELSEELCHCSLGFHHMAVGRDLQCLLGDRQQFPGRDTLSRAELF